MKIVSLSAIFLSVLILSCDKEDTLSKIDSDILIEMRESIDSSEPTLQFYCSTAKEYNCSNFGIANSVQKNSDRIEIEFNNIVSPDMCLTSIGPAKTTINLGAFSSGTYDIEIRVDQNTSTGQLYVTSEYYRIVIDNLRDLQFSYSSLNRVKSNTIWGEIGYHSDSSEMLVNSFIDSLKIIGASTQSYLPGEYGYFIINLNGQILPSQNHGYYFIQPFIFNYNLNNTTLKALVKNYGQKYGDSLNIILYTSNGEIFRSWM